MSGTSARSEASVHVYLLVSVVSCLYALIEMAICGTSNAREILIDHNAAKIATVCGQRSDIDCG